MRKVRATQDCIVRINGMPQSVKDGQAFDHDDPVVREYPWLFDSVEEATARPGERRNVTRKS